MKITPIIPYYTNFNLNNKVENSKHGNSGRSLQYCTDTFAYSPVYFRGLSLSKAQAYLDSVRPEKGFDRRNQEIYKLNLDKLDGIQEGIEVFKGLNLKEIAFIARTLVEVAVNRGCYNRCSYCYANAMPPVKESENLINKMSWEDFESLTSGFNKLNDRLGFYITRPNRELMRYRYLTTFHDSDCMTINLTDANGNQHDFIDITNALYRSTGIKGIFDTAGWTPTDRAMQERAEKFANYYSIKGNKDKLKQFNISLNTFHSLYTKSVAEKRAGNLERAKKFRNLYINRMANTIFTFTPMLKCDKLRFLSRAFEAEKIGELGEGFTIEDLDLLSKEILVKVKDKYKADFKGERKYIKSRKEIKLYLKKLKMLMSEYDSSIGLHKESKIAEYVGTENEHYRLTQLHIKQCSDRVKKYERPQSYLDDVFEGTIDSNGDFYIYTPGVTFPTELKLNFKNRNKQTPPIRPAMHEGLIISRNVINNIFWQ